MNRRTFIKKSMIKSTMVFNAAALLSSCNSSMRNKFMSMTKGFDNKLKNNRFMTQDAYKILFYASLAPSGHNSQPWSVKLLSKTKWIIELDNKRVLNVVDYSNREAMLSLGAFIENLVITAATLGYNAHIKIIAKNNFDKKIAQVELEKTGFQDYPLHRIIMRRTIKTNMISRELIDADIKAFEQITGKNIYYFPKNTRHALCMQNQAIENFKIQTENDRAQKELSRWVRFKNSDIEKYQDGITVDSMEIKGITGWYVKNFMSTRDVLSANFRNKGIEKTIEQVKQGAGWIVITSSGNLVCDLIDSGRRFQRMALIAREKNIAIHPMTQTIEEKHGQESIKADHNPGMIPQFMLRVGYVNKYPDPVSLRRPVSWFVKT